MNEAQLRPHVVEALKGGAAALLALLIYEIAVFGFTGVKVGWSMVGASAYLFSGIVERNFLIHASYETFPIFVYGTYLLFFGFGFIAVLAAKALKKPLVFVGLCTLFLVGFVVWMIVVAVELVVRAFRGIMEVLR